MRTVIGIIATLGILCGCGGDDTAVTGPADGATPDTSTQDTSTVDAPRDTPPADLGLGDTGVRESGNDSGEGGGGTPLPCPNQPCSGGQECCAVAEADGGGTVQCLATCPNGDPPIQCVGPANCGAAGPICCATVVLNGGTSPNCNVGSASSACVAQCGEMLNSGCSATDIVILCAAKSDCAKASNGHDCCTLPQTPGLPFCWDKTIATLAGGSCL